MKTVLCVCTYRRPEGLRELLDSLKQLQDADGLHVVVVDNDKQGEGAKVCESLPSDYPYSVSATVVATPGISHARNAVVSQALKLQPELLAFLDDDEQPSPQWLSELKRIQAKTNADAVGGPTLSTFPEGISEKITQNPYFGADMSLQDGAECQLQAAGNFLIRASVIEKMAPDFFHPAFAQSGGEDLAFFTQLAQSGTKMHWASNAIVQEAVPANRLTDAWMKQRVINVANSRVRVMQMLEPSLSATVIRGLKTVALGTVAGLLSAVGLVHANTREKAQLLRWKFWGKLTAHFNTVTIRGEGH